MVRLGKIEARRLILKKRRLSSRRIQFRITIKDMRTINGQQVSEEQIDEWVAEAEDGYDVETHYAVEAGNLATKMRLK